MNRVDRLFAILLFFQRKKRVRAGDLARFFEVSERTIYRDIMALCESGVPIISRPGEGYELAEGYYLPPLMFTPAEASAVALASQMLISHATGRVVADAEQALAKIVAPLSERTRQQITDLGAIFRFLAPPGLIDLDDNRLATLYRAAHERRLLRLQYHSYSHNETTVRDVELQQLSYYGGVWYLGGYCRLRQGMREFRVERIDRLDVLPETFEPRPIQASQKTMCVVEILFAADVVRWVRERQHYGFQGETSASDGAGVVMVYQVEALPEIMSWVLSWGAAAHVLSPPELREAIRQEVLSILNFLT
jgi:predicted DNA-binding transcriptional regulator YafY